MEKVKKYSIIEIILFFLIPFISQGQEKQKTCTQCDTGATKYKIRIISFQAGDPTFKMVFKNEGADPIENLKLTVQLDLDTNGGIFSDYEVGTCPPGQTVILMRSFPCDSLPKEGIAGAVSFSIEGEESEFCIISPTGNNFELDNEDKCTFNGIAVYLKGGGGLYTPEGGDTIIIQSRNETNNLVFLIGTSSGELELKDVFNSLIDYGGFWKLRQESDAYCLESLNTGEAKILEGNLDSNEVTLTNECDSEVIGKNWMISFSENYPNSHLIYCTDNKDNKKYLHKTGRRVDLTNSGGGISKAWFFHDATNFKMD